MSDQYSEQYNLASRAQTKHRADQFVEELAALVPLVGNPTSVLEIGSQFGGTAWLWSRLMKPDGTIVCVDKDVSQFTFPFGDCGLILVEGDSRDQGIVNTVRDALDGSVDFLFIDGSHEYEDVKQDWLNYSPLLSVKGVTAFHDVGDVARGPGKGVHAFWEELKREHSTLTILLESPRVTTGLGIGVVVPDPVHAKHLVWNAHTGELI